MPAAPGRGESDSGSNPGGDHPDDNHSAASAPIPSGQFFALPAGARSLPQVAILERGASHELWLMVLGLGEPATRIDADFDPLATGNRLTATLYLYTVTLYADGAPVYSLVIVHLLVVHCPTPAYTAA